VWGWVCGCPGGCGPSGLGRAFAGGTIQNPKKTKNSAARGGGFMAVTPTHLRIVWGAGGRWLLLGVWLVGAFFFWLGPIGGGVCVSGSRWFWFVVGGGFCRGGVCLLGCGLGGSRRSL